MESNNAERSAEKLRTVSVGLVGCLGCLFIFLCLFGMMFGGPFEPPGGITLEEHIQRRESGYYNRQLLYSIGYMIVYMTVAFLPHLWIIRSRKRFMLVMGLLALPLLLKIPNLVITLTRGMLWGDFVVFILILGGIKILFYGLPIISLYISWQSRKTPNELMTSGTDL